MMEVTIEIPDEVAQRFGEGGGNLQRRLLEVFIADAYRCGAISTAEVRRILQFSSRLETHDFLKQMGVYLNYDEEELERDIEILKKSK